MNDNLKETNTTDTNSPYGGRPGTTSDCVCPYCKYKHNKYKTVFNWDKARMSCEKCSKDFILINTYADTRKTVL